MLNLREGYMKKVRGLVTLAILSIFTMVSAPVHGAEGVNENGSEEKNIRCQNCEFVGGVERFFEFVSDNMTLYLQKKTYLKRHILGSSVISQDISHLSHLKDERNKKVVVWFSLFEF
jgi:hypothetical protein